MRRILKDRDSRILATSHLRASTDWIAARSQYKANKLVQRREDECFRLESAASCINAAVRGYFVRQMVKGLRSEWRAAIKIQQIIRGFLGRRKARRRRFEKYSCVPGKYSLRLLLERSRRIQQKGEWVEQFDTQTYRFWYYNPTSSFTTWDPPEEYKRELVCSWDPYPYPWKGRFDAPCRKICRDVNDYHSHRIRAHTWYCPACEYRNIGLVFPRCEICENTLDPEGHDMVKEFRVHFKQVMQEVWGKIGEGGVDGQQFAIMDGGGKGKELLSAATPTPSWRGKKLNGTASKSREHALTCTTGVPGYTLNHYYDLEASKRKPPAFPIIHDQRAQRHEKEQQQQQKQRERKVMMMDEESSNNNSNSLASSQRGREEVEEGTDQKGEGEEGHSEMSMMSAESLTAEMSDGFHGMRMTQRNPFLKTQDKQMAQKHHVIASSSSNSSSSPFQHLLSPAVVTATHSLGNIAMREQHDDVIDSSSSSSLHQHMLPSSAVTTTSSLGSTIMGEQHDEADVGVGEEGGDSRDSDEEEEGEEHGAQKEELAETLQSSSRRTGTGSDPDVPVLLPDGCLVVCAMYQVKKCPNHFHCPLAHPGLRDAAQVYPFKGPSSKSRRGSRQKRTDYVRICQSLVQQCTCEAGMKCPFYHIYIRPPTKEIIKKLYPKRKGRIEQDFQSGAILYGYLEGGLAQGYATMTWSNNDTYMGDWVKGKREGFGIFRSHDGKEYIGEWKNGCKDGKGVWTAANGETYEGQWQQGKMHGVGRLTSLNGDVYEGCFEHNQYHGFGRFSKRGGDFYLGHCKKGRAEGIGILYLDSGELYKGDLQNNLRHGRGICIYPNGGRYAGQWVNGRPSGYGIFTIPNGERYAGQWHVGKKQGYGRYLFQNGDIYDGDWKMDKAHGKGFYRHNDTGSVYVGEWEEDKRSGKGLYYTLGGSRYDGTWLENDIHGRGSFYFAPQKARYVGYFKRNRKHGKGVYTWRTGNRYKGIFVNDALEGFGEMLYATSGHRYVGEWKNNQKNGKGTFYYADGNIYDGDFKDDKKHGHGKLIVNPGLITEQSYDGEWVNDEKHGRGTYRYKKRDGTVYEGEWSHGLRHGKGILRFKDGSYYQGDFQQERFTGQGTFVSASGDQYEGEWKDNMRHGRGTQLSTADGSIYTGTYIMGIKQGQGRTTYLNGDRFEGNFQSDHPRGTGTYVLQVGGQKEEMIKVHVFGY